MKSPPYLLEGERKREMGPGGGEEGVGGGGEHGGGGRRGRKKLRLAARPYFGARIISILLVGKLKLEEAMRNPPRVLNWF